MMREGQFFTSGAVREDGGALLVTRQCLLMISADVILSSMMSKASNGPSTVMVCLTLGTLPTPATTPTPTAFLALFTVWMLCVMTLLLTKW